MPTIQETFDVVCQLAKDKSQAELLQVIDDALLAIDFRSDAYTPIMYLAEKGEHEAVTFLLDCFQASQNGAVEGYARGGKQYYSNVDALLAKKNGAKVGFAIRGYAFIGDERRVRALSVGRRPYEVRQYVEEGRAANNRMFRNKTILDYALENNVTQVTVRLRHSDDLEKIVCAFVTAGNIGYINRFPLNPNLDLDQRNDFFQKITDCYIKGGHIDSSEKLSRIIRLTSNNELRTLLSHQQVLRESSPVSNEIHQIMQEGDTAYSADEFPCLLIVLLNFTKFTMKSVFFDNGGNRDIAFYLMTFLITKSASGAPKIISRFTHQASFLAEWQRTHMRNQTISKQMLAQYLTDYENSMQSTSANRFFSAFSCCYTSGAVVTNSSMALNHLRDLSRSPGDAVQRSEIEAAVAPVANDPNVSGEIKQLIQTIRSHFEASALTI